MLDLYSLLKTLIPFLQADNLPMVPIQDPEIVRELARSGDRMDTGRINGILAVARARMSSRSIMRAMRCPPSQ